MAPTVRPGPCACKGKRKSDSLLSLGKGLGGGSRPPEAPEPHAVGGLLLSGQVMLTAADRTSFTWGRCKVEMSYFYERLGYQSEEESHALLQERRDRLCSSQAFNLTPAVILVPAPVFAVVIVSSAWSQLLNQWPEISHWQPQVARRFPLVLCIWAVIIISSYYSSVWRLQSRVALCCAWHSAEGERVPVLMC